MRREATVGAAWAVGLVLAMVSVFFYGLSVYEPERFDVSWSETEHTLGAVGEELVVGATADHQFIVPGTNVTKVVIVLEWDDPVGPNNDRLEIDAEGPAGAIDRAGGTSGHVELRFPLVAAPQHDQAEGANAAHALEQLRRPADPWRGDGAWNVTVRLVSAEGSPGTQGLGVDGENDESNDYTLRFVFITTDAILVPV